MLTSSSDGNSAAGAAAAPADAFFALPPEAPPPPPFEGRLPPALAAAAEPLAAPATALPLLAALLPAAAGFLACCCCCCCFGCCLGVSRGGGCPCGLKSSHSPSAPGNAPCAGKVACGCEMQQIFRQYIGCQHSQCQAQSMRQQVCVAAGTASAQQHKAVLLHSTHHSTLAA